MKQARRGHNAIFDGVDVIVVGGDDRSYKTEKCTIANEKVSCTDQLPRLEYYQDWPELFLVPELFCKN